MMRIFYNHHLVFNSLFFKCMMQLHQPLRAVESGTVARPVLEEIIDEEGLEYTYEQLRSMVSISTKSR